MVNLLNGVIFKEKIIPGVIYVLFFFFNCKITRPAHNTKLYVYNIRQTRLASYYIQRKSSMFA